jgi:hypothetical protein
MKSAETLNAEHEGKKRCRERERRKREQNKKNTKEK